MIHIPPPPPPDRASPRRRLPVWWQLQRCLLPLRDTTNRFQDWVQQNPLALALLYVLAGPTNTCGYCDASHYLSDSAYTRQKHDHDHCYCHDGNTNGILVLPSYCVLAGHTNTWAPVFSVVVIGHLVGVLTGPITWDPFNLLALL